MSNWVQTKDKLPEEGTRVLTIDSDGQEGYLTRHGDLWFTDSNVYVYYTPKMWRY